jgi:hypothetical protein
MALSVRNAQAATSSGGTSVTVTKPTGLTVGDWLVAYVSTTDGTSHTIATPSGWTSRGEIGVGGRNNARYAVFTKVADSGDVAASNFTISTSGPVADRMIGHVLAVMDVGAFNSIELDQLGTSAETSVSFTAASTPLITGSLALLSVTVMDNTNLNTVNSYTSTPSSTYTEHLDTTIDYGGGDPTLAVASSTISGVSQITAYGAGFSGIGDNYAGSLLLFTPINSPTTNISHIQNDATIFGPTVTQVNVGGADVSHNAVTPAINGLDPRATAPTQWTNETKPSTTWTNET